MNLFILLFALLIRGFLIRAKYLRDNLEAIKSSLMKRQMYYDIYKIMRLDEEWRKIKTQTQKIQEQRNKASLQISELKKKKKDDEAESKRKELLEVKSGIEEAEKRLSEYESQISELLWNMPNILHESVPHGKDEKENVLVRKFM